MVAIPSQNPSVQTPPPSAQLTVKNDYNTCVEDFKANGKKKGKLFFWLILGGFLGEIFLGVFGVGLLGSIAIVVGIIMMYSYLNKTLLGIVYAFFSGILLVIGLMLFILFPVPETAMLALILIIVGGIGALVIFILCVIKASKIKNGDDSAEFIQLRCGKLQA